MSKIGELLLAKVLEVRVVAQAHRRAHVYRSDDEPIVLDDGERLVSSALRELEVEVQELFYLT